jgi:hypothetical protein
LSDWAASDESDDEVGIRALRLKKPLHELKNSEKYPDASDKALVIQSRGGDEFRATIRVDDVKMDGLFDTGCHRVVISPRAVQRLTRKGVIKKIFPSKLVATLADGTAGAISGTTWVKLSYKNFTLVCIAVVMETGSNSDPDVIVGNQFMRPAKVSFDWTLMAVTPQRTGQYKV